MYINTKCEKCDSKDVAHAIIGGKYVSSSLHKSEPTDEWFEPGIKGEISFNDMKSIRCYCAKCFLLIAGDEFQ